MNVPQTLRSPFEIATLSVGPLVILVAVCGGGRCAAVASLTVAAGSTALAVPTAPAKPLPSPLLDLMGTVPRNLETRPLSLTPGTGSWDLSSYAALDFQLRNQGTAPVTVWAQAENATAKGSLDNVRTASVLAPGAVANLRLRLMQRPQDPGYAPFKPFYMYYKNLNVRDNTVDAAAVTRIALWLEPPVEKQSPGTPKVELLAVQPSGAASQGAVPFLPFVDKYGQYNHTDWPDKIHDDADFATCLQAEKAEMAAYPGAKDWDKWGGWSGGPKQNATGHFYPAKVDGKWWLVDPDGALFWSYGPTGVGTGGEGGPVTDKESWFEQLPAADGPGAKYWGTGKGARFMYYQDGKDWRSFNFSSANAERKYGPDWRGATADFLHQRLRNWGFNSIGNWSDPAVYSLDKTPYVVAIHYGGPKLENIPDVFDPAFAAAVNERMEVERGKSAGDPWNIGYYVDNELTWGYRDRAELAVRGALRAAPQSATKIALLGDLKAKYAAIADLNAKWGTAYESWDALLAARTLQEPKNPAAREADLGEFGLKFADKYFSTVRDAVKRVAPQNLYLGCRFNGHIDTAIVKIAAQYTDVISWNIYEEPGSRLNRFIGTLDKPFIVGEFGIGSAPEQTPFRGATLSSAPEDRVHAMENWVRAAAVHPLLVGGHYFQFRDQPVTGRGDGEATLRGFVNVADTPHFELVQANRRLGYGLYAMRAGSGKP